MRRSDSRISDFPGYRKLLAREGGAVYLAEGGGMFYVVIDESAFADLLSEEDLEGLELQKTLEFDDAAERDAYLRERGWLAVKT